MTDEEIDKYYSLENMLSIGVLTGSRAFNVASSDSDWDIVVTRSMLPYFLSVPGIEELIDFEEDWTEPSIDADGDITPEKMYDQATIWGPIVSIYRYIDANDNDINLFLYEDAYIDILPLFTKLNKTMQFVYGQSIADKDKRIEAFIELTDKLGITNYKG